MGTVHAKADDSMSEVGGGLFEFEEPMDLEEPPVPKPQIKLEGVRARVDRVHVDGLNRTKDDIIKNTVGELFHATDFEDVILRAHRVRRALDAMGCFRDIGVFIDVSSGPGSTPEGLEVTFQVQELSRIVGGVNTTVSENEGNLVIGAKMPNVFGRGEKLQAEYSMGYRSSSNFSVTATKPYPHKPLVPVLSTTIFQQNHEYPTSGYRLLDRGLMFDVAFKTSLTTKHNLQWEGLVRDTSVLSKTTSFKVRESSGPQMKSVLRHIVTVDHRDEPIFPSRGSWVQFTSEVSGLGGGIAYLKSDLQAQANIPLAPSIVLQLSGAMGVLHDMFGTELPDHFYLGGPTTVRGFRQRGLGPHSDGQATGGKIYWASGVHLYTPLPFQPGKNGLGELFRSHMFVNAGCLTPPDQMSHVESLIKDVRLSCGAGVALRLGRVARIELNYCVPLRALGSDATSSGLQLGIGAHFYYLATKKEAAHDDAIWCCEWSRITKEKPKPAENIENENEPPPVPEEEPATPEFEDYIITGGLDDLIKVWQLDNGKLELRHNLEGHSLGVVSVAVSPDGKTLASSSQDSTLILWDIASGDKLTTMEAPPTDVWTLDFSPDGKHVISGSNAGKILMFSTESGKEEQTLDTRGKFTLSVAYSPDGKYIASGALDGIINIFDVAQGKLVHTLEGHAMPIRSLCFSPDSQLLLTASDDGHMKLYDVVHANLAGTLSGHASWVLSVAFSPDGKRFVSGSADRTVRVWDLDTKQCQNVFKEHNDQVWGVKFNADSNKIISVSEDKNINIYDCPM